MAKLRAGDIFIYNDPDDDLEIRGRAIRIIEKENAYGEKYHKYHYEIIECSSEDYSTGETHELTSFEDEWIWICRKGRVEIKNLETQTPKGKTIKCLIKKTD